MFIFFGHDGASVLQREIFLIVFAEIQCFCLAGNAFAGVIAKFTALTGCSSNTPLGAKDLFII